MGFVIRMAKIEKNIREVKSEFMSFVSGIMDPDPDQNVQIETWVRGVPSVRISWEGDDEINRNITAYMEEEEPDIVEFEVNAWNDTYDSEGFDRRWMHDDVTVVDLKDDERLDEVDGALLESYREVSGVSGPDLTRGPERIQNDMSL